MPFFTLLRFIPMLFDFFVINHTFDEYRGKNAGCKARLFPRKKTRTNWICPDKFVRHDINRWLWEDYEDAGQTTGQIQFVRVIFWGINTALSWCKLWLMLQKTVSWREENYELYLLTLYENRSFMEKNGCRMQYYPLFLVIMIYKLLWKWKRK